jgi:hypothetical protein
MGELHDGNDIFKTDLHPRITSPAMCATPIGEVVGDRTNFTASTGHPRSIDLPVPLGAQLPSSTLINLNKTKLLEEIANQLSMGAENLMEDDKYLLE